MPPRLLTDFQVQKYYQNEPNFNSVHSRINLTEIKDKAYLINLDEYKSIGTLYIAFYVNGNSVIYFGSFGAKYIPKKSNNS